MGKMFSVFSVFPWFFQGIFGQNRSQSIRDPQLIILTKFERISTTPDPIHTSFSKKMHTFFFEKSEKRKNHKKLVFRFFEGFRPRDHAKTIKYVYDFFGWP